MTQSSVLSPQSFLPDDEARQRAAADLGTTFLVEAGAGTGKTNVLLQRLLALVRHGHSPLERIAAITFTERAAAELRVRLRAEIAAALASPLSDDERRNLREARGQLERAQIATVHAFCANLLRERPVEARVDPAFSVLDSFGASVLQAEVWREWLAQEMDHGPEILKQALRAEVTLAHLETLRDFVLEHRDCLPLLPAPVETRLPEFRATLTRALAQLKTLVASCVNPADRALAQITTLADFAATGEDNLHQSERLLLRELSLNLKAGVKTNWKPTAALDQARALLGQIAAARAQARATWSHNLSVGLARWLDGYLQAYGERKRERSSLDFVDLLLLTRDLLRHNLEVRRYFQGKFRFLLVDEFQDTDPLQAEIIFFLAEREPRAAEWTTVILQPGKLFLVGDPQQSIYRFRRADLQVYAQVREAIARQGEVLSLSTNFRTRAPALAWINETFSREFARVGADQPAYQPLAEARQEDTGREVIVLPVLGLSEKSSREEKRQAEARTVAAFLTQTVEHSGLDVWGGRTVGYRDIAVLCRTYQAMEAYEDALQEAGVPYRVLGGRRYANRQEIEEMRALLRALESPSDTAALVAILRSSLFGFSDEELAVFVSAGGRLDYTLTPPPSLPLADRFTAAFALLGDLHTRRTQLSPVAFLSEIYARTHLLPLFALHPQGVQRVANLLKLIDTARALSAQGLSTLTALNRFLDYQEIVAEEAESPVIEEHDPAVRLLTIHQAKGLEFPVVILADAVSTQRRSSRTGIVERIGGSLELRIGPRDLTCTTQGWQKAEAREQERDAAEERRLWYVAATRVRDHLVIPIAPRAEGGTQAEHWALTDDLPLQGSLTADGAEIPIEVIRKGHKVFIYHINTLTLAQPLPMLPASPVFSHVEPNAPAMRAYEEWEAERRSVLARGSQAGMISAVTALVETTALDRGSSTQGQATDAVSRQTSLRLGRAVHAALRGVSRLARLPNRQVSGLWTAAEREEAERLVQNALASPVLVRAQAATERFAEAPFVLHHQGRLLEGVIDLAFIENRTWVVVDFKTDKVTAAEATLRAVTYRPQLCLYALALERLTGRTVAELVLLFVRPQKEVTFPWGDSERALAEAMLNQTT